MDDLSDLKWLQHFHLSIEPITKCNQSKELPALTNCDSPCTYNCLVFRALTSSGRKAQPLKYIYQYIHNYNPDKYPKNGKWKSAIRLTLSTNESFIKTGDIKDKNIGVGSWTIEPNYRCKYESEIRKAGNGHKCPPKKFKVTSEVGQKLENICKKLRAATSGNNSTRKGNESKLMFCKVKRNQTN